MVVAQPLKVQLKVPVLVGVVLRVAMPMTKATVLNLEVEAGLEAMALMVVVPPFLAQAVVAMAVQTEKLEGLEVRGVSMKLVTAVLEVLLVTMLGLMALPVDLDVETEEEEEAVMAQLVETVAQEESLEAAAVEAVNRQVLVVLVVLAVRVK